VAEKIAELGEIFQGVTMIGEVSPRLQARICSYGEMMSTLMAVQVRVCLCVYPVCLCGTVLVFCYGGMANAPSPDHPGVHVVDGCGSRVIARQKRVGKQIC
jgi:hypothetical protein